MYNLKKNENDDVWYIMKAGSSFVKASMPFGKAKGIIESAEDITMSDKFSGFGICVDEGKYFFAGTFKSDEEEPADDPKSEDKTYQDKENEYSKKNKWRK